MTNDQIENIIQAATNISVAAHMISAIPYESTEAIKEAKMALIELGGSIQKLNRLYNTCLFSEDMSEELQAPE